MSFPLIVHRDQLAGMQALVVLEPLHVDVVVGQLHTKHGTLPLFGCHILEGSEEFEPDSYSGQKNNPSSLIPAF